MLTYADVCSLSPSLSPPAAGICRTFLDSKHIPDVCWRMLAYADVCSLSPSLSAAGICRTFLDSKHIPGGQEWEQVCRMLAYADVC
jgi:hypothetical protein